ncbi:hypothetical protein Tco_1526258, partial [Tanacetum coccineum]
KLSKSLDLVQDPTHLQLAGLAQQAWLFFGILSFRNLLILLSPLDRIEFVIGFGFRSGASDPKLVKVNRFCKDSEAMVFMLSLRVWKSVSNVSPALGSCHSDYNQELAKVNNLLVVLADDYDDHGYYDEVRVYGVWIMDFVTKSFTKMFTIKQPTCKWPYHGLFEVLAYWGSGRMVKS